MLRAQESSSLFRAAYKGRLDELRFLLSAGADVNSRDHGACLPSGGVAGGATEVE